MGLTPIPSAYTKKKPLDIDMSKIKMNIYASPPLPGQGAGLNPSVGSARIATSSNKSPLPPSPALPTGTPVTGIDASQSALRGWLDGGPAPAMKAAPNAAQSAKPRTAAEPWQPSKNGSLADIVTPAVDTYRVPGLGAPQTLFYSAPPQKQAAYGPDQSLNYGYEERRATWYPMLNQEQLARSGWLNAGNDSAFKRALASGFTADELTDPSPTSPTDKTPIGQSRLEGRVPMGYRPPAAQVQGQPQAQGGQQGNMSALAALVNPYNDEYQQRLGSQYQQTARDTYAMQQPALRQAFADRGLSQGGTSGIEAQAIAEASQQFNRDLGAASDRAFMETTQAQNDYGMRRALGLDTYDLANRGLLQGGQQFQDRLALDRVLGVGGLANDTRRVDLAAQSQSALLPEQQAALRAGTAGQIITNDRARQLTAPDVAEAIARASAAASNARVTGATEQERIMRAGQEVQQGAIANETSQVALAKAKDLAPLQVEDARASLDLLNKQGIASRQTIESAQWALDHKDELIAQGKWSTWAPILANILALVVGNKGVQGAAAGVLDISTGVLP